MAVNKTPLRRIPWLLPALVWVVHCAVLLITVLLMGGIFALPVEAAEGISIRGQVLDSEGKPAVGATAQLIPGGSQFELGERQMEGHLGLEAVVQVRTDAAGQFQLQAPRPGLWRVEVVAPGHSSLRAALEPLLDDTVLPTAHLEEASELRVTVRGAGGRAIAGALVAAQDTYETSPRRSRVSSRVSSRGGPSRGGPSRGGPWSWGFFYGRTDEKGEVRFQHAVGQVLEVLAWAPGYLPSERVPVEGAVVSMELTPGVPRLLEVRDFQGRPASGILVQVGASGWPVGRTDEAGRLLVAAPAAGSEEEAMEVSFFGETTWARRLDLVTPPLEKPKDVKPKDVKTKDVKTKEAEVEAPKKQVFTLPEPRTVSGTVVDGDSKLPLAGAFVWGTEGAAFGGHADRAGAFTLPVGPKEGRSFLKAAASGYRIGRQQVRQGTSQATVSLDPAATLEGRVVDQEGAPLEGVDVSAQVANGTFFTSRGAGLGMVTTGKDGEFRLRGLQPVGAYRVEAERQGFAPAAVEAVTPEAGAAVEALEITLLEGRRAFGWVVDEGEVPIPGAEVEVAPSQEQASGRRALLRSFGASRQQGELLVTDAEGHFEVFDLAAGRYDVEASAPGFAPVTVRGIEVPAGGGETELGTVILAPGVTLEGRVVDPQKVPLEGARIRLQEGQTATLMFRRGMEVASGEETDLAGRFTLRDLAAGSSFTLRVVKEGFQERSLVGVQVPLEAPLEIVLEPSFRVLGRVLDPDGEPVERAWAQLSQPQAAGVSVSGRRLGSKMYRLRAQSEKDGSFEIAGVPPGKYSLGASVRGLLPSLPVEVTVGKEDAKGVTAVLRLGATVIGQVFSPGGAPLPDARVHTFWDRGGSSMLRSQAATTTDDAGSYRLEGVESGEQTFQASHKDYYSVSKSLSVKPGENTLDLTLEQGLEVSGRVITAAGEPVVGAQLRLEPASSPRARSGGGRAVSTSDGSFRFPSVGEGRYQAVAEKEGMATGRSVEEFDVAGGPVTGVEVILRPGTTVTGRVTGLDFDALSSLQISAYAQGSGNAVGAVDYEGQYRLGPLGPGTWRVRATAGHSGQQVMEQLVVDEGVPEMQLDLDFAGGFELRGQVLQAGVPLEEARLFAQGLEGGSAASGMTNFEGKFRLTGLEAGRYNFSVLVTRSGIQHTEEISIQGDDDIEVEVGAAKISGVVRSGADGAPLAGVAVELNRVADRPGPGFGMARIATTDSQGEFSFEGVSAGSWRVKARKAGFGPAERVVSLASQDSSGIDGIELTLMPTEGLQLEVAFADGLPATRIEALLADEAGNVVAHGNFRAGESGRFHFDTAPPGRWRLQVSASQDSADASLRVEVPGPSVQVRLPPTGWLSLRVPELEASGQVATVAIQGSQGSGQSSGYLPMRSLQRVMSGGFHLVAGSIARQPLPPGTWTLTVTTHDGRTWTGTASIQGGATAEVVLE